MSEFGNYTPSPEMEALVAEHKKQKAISIAETIAHHASVISKISKTLPKDGKHNPFRKTYNRRPRNKQKRALVMMQIAINTRITQGQLGMIAATPIPLYKKGSISPSGMVVVSQAGSEQIFHNNKIIEIPKIIDILR